jgi:4,5:9,10-diseco-3-hydroxy-5,9,17-trioxoandrosta-1(10),2-diene-4-oate hydrolase
VIPKLRSGFTKVGRLNVHHTYGGRGSPALFIHGLGSSGYMEWRFNLPAAARGRRVYAPDLPGFGRSEKPRARYGIPYFARVLDRYLEGRRLASADVVGTSLGGRIALELALKYPERVRKLVLVNALGLGRPRVQLHYPLMILPWLGETVMGIAKGALRWAPANVIRKVAARYAGASVDLAQAMDEGYLGDLRELYADAGFTKSYLATVRSLVTPKVLFGEQDLTGELKRIEAETLFIWGADDTLFPLEHATRAHSEMTGSRLAIIEGAGHTPHAERPEEFNRILTGFLAD